MKTAIINTDFWKDDSIFDLNTDTRLFYLAILTNPERNTSPAFKCSDRMMSTFTGYDKDLLPLLRKQLIEQGRIQYESGYYIILDQAYIKPTKGKLSSTLLEKYLNELPSEVRVIVDNFLMSGSGVVQEYKDKDKDITKDKHNDKDIELAELLKEKVELNFPSKKELKISSWYDEFRKLREIDNYSLLELKTVICWVHGGHVGNNKFNEHHFWSANIRSAGKLRKQMDTLVAQMQQQYKKSQGIISNNKVETI